jgi:hypothetical protein
MPGKPRIKNDALRQQVEEEIALLQELLKLIPDQPTPADPDLIIELQLRYNGNAAIWPSYAREASPEPFSPEVTRDRRARVSC